MCCVERLEVGTITSYRSYRKKAAGRKLGVRELKAFVEDCGNFGGSSLGLTTDYYILRFHGSLSPGPTHCNCDI